MRPRVDLELKQQLAHELRGILEDWTASEIIACYGWYPARVSELRHGNLARFSIARLVQLITDCGYDIRITIRPTEPPRRTFHRATATVVRLARGQSAP